MKGSYLELGERPLYTGDSLDHVVSAFIGSAGGFREAEQLARPGVVRAYDCRGVFTFSDDVLDRLYDQSQESPFSHVPSPVARGHAGILKYLRANARDFEGPPILLVTNGPLGDAMRPLAAVAREAGTTLEEIGKDFAVICESGAGLFYRGGYQPMFHSPDGLRKGAKNVAAYVSRLLAENGLSDVAIEAAEDANDMDGFSLTVGLACGGHGERLVGLLEEHKKTIADEYCLPVRFVSKPSNGRAYIVPEICDKNRAASAFLDPSFGVYAKPRPIVYTADGIGGPKPIDEERGMMAAPPVAWGIDVRFEKGHLGLHMGTVCGEGGAFLPGFEGRERPVVSADPAYAALFQTSLISALGLARQPAVRQPAGYRCR